MPRKLLHFLSLIVFVLFLPLSTVQASEHYKDLLHKDLNDYVSCWREANYRCMSAYILPPHLKLAGGTQGFIKLMEQADREFKSQGLVIDHTSMRLGAPSNVKKFGAYLVSTISTSVNFTLKGKPGVMDSTLLAVSSNSGNTWFYIEGNKDGQEFVSLYSNGKIKYIHAPQSTMTIGGRTIPID